MMKIPRFCLSSAFLAFAATFLCVSSIRAASGTWLNSGATDANWSTTSNWVGGTVPGATSGTTNADVATFNTTLGTYGTSGTPVVIDSGRNLKSILFDTASAGAFTIGSTGGNALLLTSGGSITMNATVANTETINAPLVIQAGGGSYTIQNNATDNSKLLNIGGAITGGAAGQTTLTLNGTNTGNNTISGNISKGSATDFAIVKNGAGTWILSGTNAISNSQNFNSAVAVNAGTLNIQGATTVSKGRISVVAGSTLDVSGAGTFAVTGGTTNTPVSISGALLLDDTGGTQKTNRVSGSFTLSSGGGFSYLGNASANSTETNTGGITLGSGLSKITVSYGGTQAATVTEASLSHAASTGGVALINGTNLGANAAGSGSVGLFLTTALPSLVGTTTGGSTGISSGVTNTKIALFVLGESGAVTGANGTATGAANTFLTYNATTGYRPLNPTDEFTNDAIMAGDNTYLAAGTTTTSGTTAINSLVVNGGNLAITSGNLTNTSGMLLFAQNGTISGAGTFTLGGASNQEGVVALDSGVNATISAVLGTGTTGLTVSGPGTLTLSGANSYAGTTAVGVGSTLIIGNNSALGSSSITAVGGTIQGDGQARTIANTLIDTTSGMTIGGSSDLTFTGGGTVSAPAFANATNANSKVNVNNTGTTTFSGVFSLNNQTSGSNNGSSVLAFGSSANVVIAGPIQDNNTGNVAAPGTGLGSLSFTGVGANLTISPTVSNNAYGTGKTTTIVADAAYNTVTVGGPGGSGATITPFGATTLNFNTGNPLFLVAETNGQILGNNFNSGGSGFAVGFAGTNSMTLGGTWAASAGSTFTNLATGTFTFGNTISGNALSLFGTGNTTLNSSATLAAGAFALTATQAGTVTLSNVNNFTGVTAFNGGTVVLDYGTNNNTKLTQNSTAGSAAALSLAGVNLQLSGGSFAQTLGTPSSGSNGTTLNAGQSKITQTNSGTSTIALGAITRSAGAAIDFQTGIASTTTASTSGILGGYATVGGADWATGGGTIAALSGYDSFATPGTNKNILQADGGSVAASTTVNSLKITTSTTGQSLAITSGQILSLTTGGLLFTGANDYSITGGTLKPTASSGDFIVQQYGAGVLTIDSVISGTSGAATLTKAGTGTLALTGVNTYTGATYLTGGILQIGADNNLGTVGAINFNGGTLETTAGFSTSRTMSLATNGGTFQVDTGTLTSTGVISGTSYKGLTKTGAGTLLLQGTNTFLGPVTVSDGTLQLGNAAALGASSTGSNRSVAPVLVNGGTLDINGQTTALGNVTLQSGAISDTAGTGTLAAYSFNLQSGTVGAKLTDLVFAGATSNSINVYKTTSGTVTLSGANIYTGGTTISGGKLSIASTGTINASGGVFIGAGEFNYNSSTALSAPVNFTGTGGTLSGTGTISSAVTITSGNTLSPGNSPGVMTFNNTLTLAGATAMEANGTTRGVGGYDGINTGTGLLTYGGTLTITFGSTFLTGGETFDLFNIGAGGSTGDFSLVSVAGSYLTSLTNASGVWTGNTGGFDFTFTQSTGDLVIAASTIPEPATYAAIFGAMALAGVVWRRRARA